LSQHVGRSLHVILLSISKQCSALRKRQSMRPLPPGQEHEAANTH
jgi:hypothetical protein